MVPTPVAVGLTFCEKLIVEEATRNLSMVNCFSQVRATSFPHLSAPFFVVAALTNSQGTGTIELALTRLETDELIQRWQYPIQFPDRFAVVRVRFRISDCSFPAPGRYQFTLLVDGEWAAQRDMKIVQPESQP
jgi:hypothetical protein